MGGNKIKARYNPVIREGYERVLSWKLTMLIQMVGCVIVVSVMMVSDKT